MFFLPQRWFLRRVPLITLGSQLLAILPVFEDKILVRALHIQIVRGALIMLAHVRIRPVVVEVLRRGHAWARQVSRLRPLQIDDLALD